MTRSKNTSDSKTSPHFVKRCSEPNLFPKFKETSRERYFVSIFLAMLPHTPDLWKALLTSAGLKVGKSTNIFTFTEIVPKGYSEENTKKRIDGLVFARTRKKGWIAPIEAKTGIAKHDQKQISTYLELTKGDIDAFITISNDFVVHPEHPVVEVKPTLIRKIKFVHWSWTYIMTQCKVICCQSKNENNKQKFFLEEFIKLLENDEKAVKKIKQLPKCWGELNSQLDFGKKPKKNTSLAKENARVWLQVSACLTLMMAQRINQEVKSNYSDKPNLNDLVGEISKKIENGNLDISLITPSISSSVDVVLSLVSRTITVSMSMSVPKNKGTKGIMNWLLNKIEKKDSRTYVTATWPGRAAETTASLEDLRENPMDSKFIPVRKRIPTGLRVGFRKELGSDLMGSGNIVSSLEKIVCDYYDFIRTFKA